MFQILVVEDDKELCDLFCTVLTDNGYTAVPAADGLAAFDILDDTYIDLVISDIMMPRMDGFELTKALRESGYTMPILIITAKESTTDKREGFRLGTDDYMVKPFVFKELLARIKVMTRRKPEIQENVYRCGDLVIDYNTHEVTRNNIPIALSPKEFAVLLYLVRNILSSSFSFPF